MLEKEIAARLTKMENTIKIQQKELSLWKIISMLFFILVIGFSIHSKSEQVKAKDLDKIIIRDSSGRKRIKVGFDNNGRPGLFFYDEDGSLRKDVSIKTKEINRKRHKLGHLMTKDFLVYPDHKKYPSEPICIFNSFGECVMFIGLSNEKPVIALMKDGKLNWIDCDGIKIEKQSEYYDSIPIFEAPKFPLKNWID